MGAISVEKVNGEVMISSPGWRRRRSLALVRAHAMPIATSPGVAVRRLVALRVARRVAAGE